MSRRLETSTITDDGDLVPWLAARGPLAYTPETPPTRDYYFQYGWVMPGILSEYAEKRRHFYFGGQSKDEAAPIFAFWNAARERAATRVALLTGRLTGSAAADGVCAPVAVYAACDRLHGPGYVFIQHGSYQRLDVEEQPLLDAGEVVLYRGVGDSDSFVFQRVGSREPTGEVGAAWTRYAATQLHVMSDAVRSFNSIHDRARRSETTHILDGSWITDDFAASHGLDLTSCGPARDLWHVTHQSFTLVKWVAERKFGPSYIKCLPGPGPPVLRSRTHRSATHWPGDARSWQRIRTPLPPPQPPPSTRGHHVASGTTTAGAARGTPKRQRQKGDRFRNVLAERTFRLRLRPLGQASLDHQASGIGHRASGAGQLAAASGAALCHETPQRPGRFFPRAARFRWWPRRGRSASTKPLRCPLAEPLPARRNAR